jgi:hypothetical protein
MAVVAFWGNCEKETGQTISTIAVATMMAIEHNFKILVMTTGFKDTTINESFWEPKKTSSMIQRELGIHGGIQSMESGIEGLSRVIQSNRGRTGLIPDYAKVVFKDRLDVLVPPRTKDYQEYLNIARTYPSIVALANTDYNMVLVDVDKRLPTDTQKEILENADVIVITINQGLTNVEKLVELKRTNELFQKDNTLVLIGKYDRYSKYNLKNISRYLRESDPISAISYNTLFFESTTEGKVADYFLRYRNLVDKNDRNSLFIEETRKTCSNIVSKIQSVQKRR